MPGDKLNLRFSVYDLKEKKQLRFSIAVLKTVKRKTKIVNNISFVIQIHINHV